MGIGIVGFVFQGLFVHVFCVIEFALNPQQYSKVIIGDCIFNIEFDGFAKWGFGFLQFFGCKKTEIKREYILWLIEVIYAYTDPFYYEK